MTYHIEGGSFTLHNTWQDTDWKGPPVLASESVPTFTSYHVVTIQKFFKHYKWKIRQIRMGQRGEITTNMK